MGVSISSSIGPPSRRLGAAFTCCRVVAEAVVEVVVATLFAVVVAVVSYSSACLEPNVVCGMFGPMSAGEREPRRSLLIPYRGPRQCLTSPSHGRSSPVQHRECG